MTAGEVFGKRFRLPKSRDFRRVFAGEASCRRSFLMLRWAPNGLAVPRLGVAVSARGIPAATKRNRIKRLLREVFRKHRPQIKDGVDIVASVRSVGPGPVSYKKMEELFLSLARRAGVTR